MSSPIINTDVHYLILRDHTIEDASEFRGSDFEDGLTREKIQTGYTYSWRGFLLCTVSRGKSHWDINPGLPCSNLIGRGAQTKTLAEMEAWLLTSLAVALADHPEVKEIREERISKEIAEQEQRLASEFSLNIAMETGQKENDYWVYANIQYSADSPIISVRFPADHVADIAQRLCDSAALVIEAREQRQKGGE